MAAPWNSDNKDQSHRNVKALLQQHSPPTYVTRLGCSLIPNVGTPPLPPVLFILFPLTVIPICRQEATYNVVLLVSVTSLRAVTAF